MDQQYNKTEDPVSGILRLSRAAPKHQGDQLEFEEQKQKYTGHCELPKVAWQSPKVSPTQTYRYSHRPDGDCHASLRLARNNRNIRTAIYIKSSALFESSESSADDLHRTADVPLS